MYDTVGIRWESNPDEKAKITKKVNEALDFFQKVANAANTRRGGQGIGIGQFSLLTRIYFKMRDNYMPSDGSGAGLYCDCTFSIFCSSNTIQNSEFIQK